MKRPIDTPFPDSKISEAFLEFAEPILGKEGEPPTVEETEKVLSVAFVVWNTVVYDTVHGNTEWVTRLRKQIAHDAPLSALIEGLIARKQTQFGHDLRLVGNYKIVEKNGEWRLRAAGAVADGEELTARLTRPKHFCCRSQQSEQSLDRRIT